MRKDAVFTIAGVDYHTQQLPAAEAFDLLRLGDCLLHSYRLLRQTPALFT